MIVDEIAIGERLGKGGEAEVFRLANDPAQLLKVFEKRRSVADNRRLDTIIAHGSLELRRHAAWPTDRLEWEGQDALLMPFVKGRESHVLMDRVSRLGAFPGTTWYFAVTAARSIAQACGVIHESGFLIVDLSERNILVDHEAKATLIDCDSFVTSLDGLSPLSEMGTIKYLPPELANANLKKTDRSADHDCYGLAYVLFKLLFQGSDPMLAADPRAAPSAPVFAFQRPLKHDGRPTPYELSLDDVTEDVARLFERAFSTPGDRPTARAWEGALDEMSRRMRRCDAVSTHAFVEGAPECPWCKRARLGANLDTFRIEAAPQAKAASAEAVGRPGTSSTGAAPIASPGVFAAAAQPFNTTWLGRNWGKALLGAFVVLVLLYVLNLPKKPAPEPVQEVPVEQPPSPTQVEDNVWSTARSTPLPDGVAMYLQEYPEGRYVDAAQGALTVWARRLAVEPLEAKWRARGGVNVRAAPHQLATKRFELTPGQEVNAIGTVTVGEGVWLIIPLSDGTVGYSGRLSFDQVMTEPEPPAPEPDPSSVVAPPPPPRVTPPPPQRPRPPVVAPRVLPPPPKDNTRTANSRSHTGDEGSQSAQGRDAVATEATLDPRAYKRWASAFGRQYSRDVQRGLFGDEVPSTSVVMTVRVSRRGEILRVLSASGGNARLRAYATKAVLGERLYYPLSMTDRSDTAVATFPTIIFREAADD